MDRVPVSVRVGAHSGRRQETRTQTAALPVRIQGQVPAGARRPHARHSLQRCREAGQRARTRFRPARQLRRPRAPLR